MLRLDDKNREILLSLCKVILKDYSDGNEGEIFYSLSLPRFNFIMFNKADGADYIHWWELVTYHLPRKLDSNNQYYFYNSIYTWLDNIKNPQTYPIEVLQELFKKEGKI